MSKNPGNVAGGLKATLNNPRVSDEAKNDAKERLDAMKSGAPVDEVQTQTSATDADKNPGNQIGGYKATLSNPNVSKEAKQHAKEMLDSGSIGKTVDDEDYVPPE
ncbi:Conidiation protein 6-domain-containing protein [Pterulicium gracile]|uniref:Conidiation protein 6-domain-containing protein n=1 Tax=Pterulicium gracile TaxID=1884261 RepID=A0A5C3QXY6_9AGAR|nr:Conidiation protein 6-domain-containing protein [Pterula gracilis]